MKESEKPLKSKIFKKNFKKNVDVTRFLKTKEMSLDVDSIVYLKLTINCAGEKITPKDSFAKICPA